MATGLIKQGDMQASGHGFQVKTGETGGYKDSVVAQQPVDEAFLKHMRSLGQSRMKAGPVVPDVITPMEAWFQKTYREGDGEIYEREFSKDPREIKIAEQIGSSGPLGAWAKTQDGQPIISLNLEIKNDWPSTFRHEGPGHIVFQSLRGMGELDNIPFPEAKNVVADSLRLLVNAGYEDAEIDAILGESLIKLNIDGYDWTMRDFHDLLQSDKDRFEMVHGSGVGNWPLAYEHGLVNPLARDPTLVENVVGWDDPATQTTEGLNRMYESPLGLEGELQRMTSYEAGRGELGEFETPFPKHRDKMHGETSEDYLARMARTGANDPISYAILQGKYGERAIKKINHHIKENLLGKEGWLEEMAWYQDNVGSY